MSVLPDWMIERDVKIEPFSPQCHRPGVISYGVTSYGYDVRAGYKWRVFDVLGGASIIDPKNFDPKLLKEFDLTPKKRDHNWITIYNSDRGPGLYRCGSCGEETQDDGYWQRKDPCPKKSAVTDHVVIPPNSYALGESFETFTIPRDVLCICVGKSTYARCGIIVNVTPGEPEWTGKWTIEISNSTPLPAKVYCGEGIMQCVFVRGEMTCKTSYADKKGKYQGQTGVTNPKVES